VDCSFRLDKRTRGDRGECVGGQACKEAVVEDGPVVYDKIPKEVIVTREKDHGLQMWGSSGWVRESGQLQKFFSHQ